MPLGSKPTSLTIPDYSNPTGRPEGFQPLTAGMVAALPHCDDFLAGHSLACFQELSRLLSDEGRTRA